MGFSSGDIVVDLTSDMFTIIILREIVEYYSSVDRFVFTKDNAWCSSNWVSLSILKDNIKNGHMFYINKSLIDSIYECYGY